MHPKTAVETTIQDDLTEAKKPTHQVRAATYMIPQIWLSGGAPTGPRCCQEPPQWAHTKRAQKRCMEAPTLQRLHIRRVFCHNVAVKNKGSVLPDCPGIPEPQATRGRKTARAPSLAPMAAPSLRLNMIPARQNPKPLHRPTKG